MASVSVVVDASSAAAYAREVAAAGLAIHAGVRKAIVKTAHDIEADAKALCPVDTGYLRSSITADIGDMDAEIGPTANYGAYVEFGTSRMGPQPYMMPAADRREPELTDAIAVLVGELL
ncbi:MAG: HK97 gp10 family phage protein [Streptosporangiales bacterium]|nr:HK97 gp10 family phage protein [Streptosporangiales bacterium]